MLLQELDQVLTRDASVLRTGNAVTLQSSRIEPFANGSWCHFADFGDLSGSEDLHYGLSVSNSLVTDSCRVGDGWHALMPLLPLLRSVNFPVYERLGPQSQNLGRGVSLISLTSARRLLSSI